MTSSMTSLPRLGAALAILLASSARAQVPGVDPATPPPGPDHGKMATEEATPVGHRAIEVEAAYSPSLTSRGSGSFDRSPRGHSHAYSLAVFYGVTEHLDAKVAGGFAYLVDRSDLAGPTRGSGASDLVIGTRWRFVADSARALDLCVATTVVAPSGADAGEERLGLTQGHWSVRNALVASKDWGRTTANAELALTVPVGGGAGTLDGAVAANLAFGHALRSWLQPIAEVNYDVARDGRDAQRLAVTAGLNMTSRAGTRLLVGVQQAVWGRNVAQDTTALVATKAAF